MVRLDKVEKAYGRDESRIVALAEVSLAIKEGEFVIVTGPSGSGKTTLLNVIGGMTRPDRGELRVAGRDLLSLPDPELSRFRARTLGFVFQFQSMLPALDALDNVRLPLFFAGAPDDPERARALLEEAGLGSRTRAFARELSAGQQKRVCVARALVNRPRLLLCDEPTGDLDPETETAIMVMIQRANQDGATVVMTTHNLALAAYASRRLKITDGEVAENPGPG